MCGILGLSYKDIDIGNYNEIKKILSHRGPDNSSLYDKDNLLFVHNRLSIIDLSESANQPMIDNDTGNIIIFNGEIYNYKKLKKE